MAATSASRRLQPRDAEVVTAILHSMGVDRFEPRVLHQLLEYMHRYCHEIFQDGANFAEHSGRAGQIECEDVQLAVRLKAAASQTIAPQLIDTLARTRNREKLPSTHRGENPPLNAMPQLDMCMLQRNYQLEPAAPEGVEVDEQPADGEPRSALTAGRTATHKARKTIQIKLGKGEAEDDADADAEAMWE